MLRRRGWIVAVCVVAAAGAAYLNAEQQNPKALVLSEFVKARTERALTRRVGG